MEKNIFIVIPVFNEASVVAAVIKGLREKGYKNIIVIDDGSSDTTFAQARSNGVIALRHKINRGKGAAVKTGVAAACLLGADVVVTMDGDGQHCPDDIESLVQPICCDGIDVVLGTRLLKVEGMPLFKILANQFGNFVTWLFYGIKVSDSQSGFRAYSRFAASKIDTRADKYEYDSKVIREINHNRLSFVEVPIKVVYTDYSQGKPQKQGFVNGIKTLVRMVWDMIV
ncbi:glycosyltransferase family 2 protein [Desulfopila sp. IMCC35008]|uniref:glycosyltransferase family 2 protein n=1 Tax=Desulfopila sp. IMCC35008 TaxID=2653858 RepID=UPI0013D7F443|nr:glycosyltransferase family 2 protein [Desulfopila sp. IMCC35008]